MPAAPAIYSAVVATLVNDATLTNLMPDGVYRDVAKAGATRFVIVSKMADSRAYVFDGIAYEELTYLVKAVSFDTSGVVASQAAARIYTLLHEASLTIAGYTLQSIRQAEENGVVEYTEADAVNQDARWQHRGWLFDVTVST